MVLVTIQLDSQETMALLQLARARLMEIERMIDGLEEAEGMDLPRHNAIKTMRPQADLVETIVLKLEGAAKDLGTGR
jgi:hypothetical protein